MSDVKQPDQEQNSQAQAPHESPVSAEGSAPASPNRRRHRLKRAGLRTGRIWLLSLAHLSASLMTLGLFLVAVLAYTLGSESGRVWLLQEALPKVLAETEFRLETRDVGSPEFGNWSFAYLAFYIEEQPVVIAEDFRLSLQWQALLQGNLDVSEISASSLQVKTENFPPARDDDTAPAEPPALPETLPMVRLQSVSLARLQVTGTDPALPALSMQGHASLFVPDILADAQLQARTLIPQEAVMELKAQLSEYGEGEIKLSLDEQAGGWVGSLLGYPADKSLQVNVDARAQEVADGIQVTLAKADIPWESHRFEIDGKVLVAPEREQAQLQQVRLRVDGEPQIISGTASATEGDLQLQLSRLPLSLVEPWVEDLQGGSLSGQVSLQGAWQSPGFTFDISGNTRFRDLPLSLDAKGQGNPEQVGIDDATAALGDLSVRTRGAVNIQQESLDLQIVNLSGPLDYLSLLDVTLTEDLVLQLEVSEGKVQGPWAAPEYAGKVQARGSFRQRPLNLKGGFRGSTQRVTLQQARLTSLDSEVTANGVIDWTSGGLDLDATASRVPLSLLDWLDIELPVQGLQGVASAQGRVSGPFDSVQFDGDGDIDATLSAQNLLQQTPPAPAVRELEPARLTVSTDLKASAQAVTFRRLDTTIKLPESSARDRADPAVTKPATESSIKVSGTLNLEKSQLDLKTRISDLSFRILDYAGITYPDGLVGVVDADLDLAGPFLFPVVRGELQSRGVLAGEPFNLALGGEGEQDKIRFDNTEIRWRESVLTLQGSLARDSMDFSLDLQQFNTRYLQDFGIQAHPVEISATARVTGSLEQPELHGQILANTLYQLGPDTPGRKPSRFDLAAEVSLLEDTLTLDTRVDENGRRKGSFLLDLPWRSYVNHATRRGEESSANGKGDDPGSNPKGFVSADMPVAGRARGNFDLAWFNELLDEDIQTMQGNLEMDLAASGILSDPQLDGYIALSEGYYSNQLSQTTLQQIVARLALEGRQVVVQELSAADGIGGTVSGEGYVRWDNQQPAGQDPVALELFADKVSLLRRDDMEGVLSGTLSANGDFRKILLSGDIQVSPFQLMLDLISDADIPELDVRVVEDEEPAPKDQQDIPLPEVVLDIALTVDQQGFIRGRGLDAELEGKVLITGPAQSSEYEGRFSVVRGTFELFGKRFDLRTGDVLFENESAVLYIEGYYSGSEFDYIATLSGTLQDLKVKLRTIPDLPEDEALSRLLFGKSVRNITPLQAARLAAAVQTLRGEGGFDPIAATREVLGVDTLTVDSQETSEGNGVSVGVGKYVTEKVYVELERTPEPSQPWKGSVEIELTPKLNLETTTGTHSGFGGVELLWKHDY